MAVSGTTAFAMTVSEIVTEARGLLGIQAVEEPLQAHELAQGIRALNMLLATWEVEGVKTYLLTEGQLTLVEGQASYTFGAGGDFTTVFRELTDARINRSGNDLPMERLSREQYYALPNKTTEGYPTSYFFDTQREGGTLYVWPAPDSTAGTFKFTYRRQLYDAGNGTDTLDVPKYYLEAVVYNLAKRLIPFYPGAAQISVQAVVAGAASTYATVSTFDAGEGKASITIEPEWNW